MNNVAPTPPSGLTVETPENGYWKLSWQPATDNDKRNAPMYVIYGSDTYPVDTSNPENILAQRVQGTEYTYAPSARDCPKIFCRDSHRPLRKRKRSYSAAVTQTKPGNGSSGVTGTRGQIAEQQPCRPSPPADNFAYPAHAAPSKLHGSENNQWRNVLPPGTMK